MWKRIGELNKTKNIEISYMNENLEILNNVNPSQLRQFLLNLGFDTKHNFTYFDSIDSTNIQSIVENEMKRNDKIKFFSFVKDNLIAYSFLTKFSKPTKKHNCILGIVIEDKWQGKGYGRKICEHMIQTAWRHGIKKIWLTVYSDNIAALQLYKSIGFEIEGIFMADELADDTERHIISMALFKEKKFGPQDRLRLWQNLEQQ